MSMQQQIYSKLADAIACKHLNVINESHMHSRGSESHFKVIAVSEKFAGQRLLQRHRLINEVLKEELAHHIHALAIHTYTPEEYAEQHGEVPDSPSCLGGSKFDSE
ncbi:MULTISPECIES: BolA/IbaG family iron-sulfur metabolism protein [Pseudoalteromonas]|uniref:BolA/IbaG family iron-sulfur metabolism protein n=1 Tax=Pseudoalteromonas rubra TaxID=43658 RepID=A0A5S3V5F2_9GAMM|nr:MULTISPECIES: BolA/IbaG family iron-sulfur metabolism protein [Pseudoalteromonas]KAF7788990.1 BolA protein [Pseudoalteromonas rubra]MCG7561860.1 BolA/IbaG family iron-sulfur metabolism protein [Pseudoalteromonas sp. McH1-42]MDK1312205.1 BolA/IbaG family iron-sulfur metabolism protein [Pseudoalteromonas sp. R96]MEC4088666.1 BolA/IbaG family iron-sulfur metabolism protein [Pseudoalteromonas rubra]QPB82167.1 BolA/IbaG family iron-sulfur metabolism protein [Pseudoalteromonas rubra]